MRKGLLFPSSLPGVIQKGNFYPATEATPQVTKYMSLQKGALCTYNMATVYGGPWDEMLNAVRPAAPRSLMNLRDFPGETIVNRLADQGYDYIVFTVREEQGFHVYPSRVPRNFAPVTLPAGPNGSDFISPSYPDGPFGAWPGAMDPHVIEKLLNTCYKRGLEFVPYDNLIANLEVFNGQMSYNQHILANYPRYQEYADYWCRTVQEFLIRYPVNYIWLDKASPVTPAFSQATYNAAKAINPSITIIGNTTGESEMSLGRGPYDIASVEEYALFAGNKSHLKTRRDFAGQLRYTPSEFVLTPHKYNRWYKYDEFNLFPYAHPYEFQPKQDFQRLLDMGKQNGCPVLIGILIDRNGNLAEDTLAFVDTLNFGRNVQLTVVGDSLTAGPAAGSGSQPEFAPIAFAAAKLQPAATFTKFGTPGKDMRWFLDNQKELTAAALVGQGRNFLIGAFGANDIPLRTRAQREADFQEFITWALSLPVEGILLVPVMNRLDTGTGGYAYALQADGSRTDFNAERLHHNNEFLPSLLSLSPKIQLAPTPAALFADNAPNDTTLFTADKVHLTIAGSQRMGELVLAAGCVPFGNVALTV